MTTPTGKPTADMDLMDAERPTGFGDESDRKLIQMCDEFRALGMHDRAAQIGKAVNDIPDRPCGVTHKQAGGYAFLPGTNIPVSNGMYDTSPTVYDKVVGSTAYSRASVVRTGKFLDLRLTNAENFDPDPHGLTGNPQGGELAVLLLGLAAGNVVEFTAIEIDGEPAVVMRKPKP